MRNRSEEKNIRKAVFMTLITPHGLIENSYCFKLIFPFS
jgi:hypothetical protein